jgi:hypothetical protein
MTTLLDRLRARCAALPPAVAVARSTGTVPDDPTSATFVIEVARMGPGRRRWMDRQAKKRARQSNVGETSDESAGIA